MCSIKLRAIISKQQEDILSQTQLHIYIGIMFLTWLHVSARCESSSGLMMARNESKHVAMWKIYTNIFVVAFDWNFPFCCFHIIFHAWYLIRVSKFSGSSSRRRLFVYTVWEVLHASVWAVWWAGQCVRVCAGVFGCVLYRTCCLIIINFFSVTNRNWVVTRWQYRQNKQWNIYINETIHKTQYNTSTYITKI
jgi:hypothetical protein